MQDGPSARPVLHRDCIALSGSTGSLRPGHWSLGPLHRYFVGSTGCKMLFALPLLYDVRGRAEVCGCDTVSVRPSEIRSAVDILWLWCAPQIGWLQLFLLGCQV